MSGEQYCAFCRRQFSQYTCPKCNAPYCSLVCFRSNAHSACSETFYKDELRSGIQSSSSANHEERLKMMEILKRFEEESQDDSLDVLSDENDEDDLLARLGSLNVENATSEELWELLTPDERARFIKAVKDPKSDLAQTLLTVNHKATWWEDSQNLTASALADPHEDLPSPIRIPSVMMNSPLQASHPLPIWNLVAVLISYAYTVRHLGISSLSSSPADAADARKTVSKLVPFLVDRKSKTTLPSLESTITDLWSRLGPDEASPGLFHVLLQDVAKLLQPLPPIILPVSSLKKDDNTPDWFNPLKPMHPHAIPVLALSDLHTLFHGELVKQNTQNTATAHKIMYYAMHILRVPSDILKAVVLEVRARSERFESESIGQGDLVADATERPRPHRPLVEEMESR